MNNEILEVFNDAKKIWEDDLEFWIHSDNKEFVL